MDPNHVPLISEAEQITAEWIRQALAAGGPSHASDIAAVEVEHCRTSSRPGQPLSLSHLREGRPGGRSRFGHRQAAQSDAMAFRFSRWLSLHRREPVFYRDIAPLGYVRTPKLFYGDFDQDSNRSVLCWKTSATCGGSQSVASTQHGLATPYDNSPGCRGALGGRR